MFKTGLAFLLGTCLALQLWIGNSTPAFAQSFTSTSVALMAKDKPLFSFSGTRPTNLGVKQGKLLPCPGTPNCVNSQTDPTDQEHSIAPLSYESSTEVAIARLKSVINNMERTEIISESPNYLYAEFTSALMGYVDDVEFFVDEAAGLIQVRSASRLGQSDLGVNRKRVEAIRTAFNALKD